jgi:EAL domain-containing protein (putative c-di-GMP-specific phosphodiesterase class I)/GGDEF domain-containing protein
LANLQDSAKLKTMTQTTPKLLTALCFWVIASLSPSVLAFEISDAYENPIDHFWILIDENQEITPETLPLHSEVSWTEHNNSDFNLGYTQSTVWVKLEISNSSPASISKILDINYPLLDQVILYQLGKDNKLIEVMTSGDATSFSDKSFVHPNHVQILNLETNTSSTYFIKIRSNSPIQSQFIVWGVSEFQQYYRALAAFNFTYLGLILSIVIFNFFVFLFLKEKVYLHYTIYATLFALLMASQNGVLFEYIYPESPAFQNWSQLIFSAGVISFTAIFHTSFLKLSEQSLGRKILSIIAIVPLLILLASAVIGFSLAIQIMVGSALISIPTCFAVGIKYSRTPKDRQLYILAWSWLIAGVISFLLLKLGFIPFNIFSTNSIQIGSAFELITFSIALARRINTEKETRIRVQEIIIENSKRTAQLHKDLLHAATRHPITGQPNLAAFESWLETEINQSKNFSVVYIQLSRINEINKTLGRQFGEEALKVLSERLNFSLNSDAYKNNCMPLNKAGDAFSATLNSNTLGIITETSVEDGLMDILKNLKKDLDKPLKISRMDLEPYLALSISSYPEDGDDASLLLRRASIAMDRANTAEDQMVKYSTDIDPYNEQRLNMMADLTQAIANNKLVLHYQPLVDTHTKKILGAEALIRWPHDIYGMIMPDQFIELAEQTGVIQALSLWVLRSAIKQQVIWSKINPDFLLSVNISALNLQDKSFIEAVNILFMNNSDLAKHMILEVTESQMMTDTQHALQNLWQLSELGLHIAIDDFGTGYSNLAYLKKLPASELKIDKTFILNLESDKQNQVLVQTAIHMAHNLGLKVVAEGVESEHARAILSEMDCDICQGYHFSRPIPAQQFDALLSK